MKRYIRANNYMNDEDFIPNNFTEDSANDVFDDLYQAIKDKFARRFKKLEINFQNEYYNGNKLGVDVTISNNGVEKGHSRFNFEQYSDYFDQSDYQQHIDTTIQKFLRTLVK